MEYFSKFLFLIFLSIFLSYIGIFLSPVMIYLAIFFLLFRKRNKNKGIYQNVMNEIKKDKGIYRATDNDEEMFSSAISKELEKVDSILKQHFKTKSVLELRDGLELVLKTKRYINFSKLNVYRQGNRIGTIEFFQSAYPQAFQEMMDEILAMKNFTTNAKAVQDAQFVRHTKTTKPEENNNKTKHRAVIFMEQINELNDDIPDQEISTGLYETVLLLKQMDIFEEKFSGSAEKLDRLYIHYLPILVRILKQYSRLQIAKTDPSYEKNCADLKKTIRLINDAMKHIISTLTDNDFINLSADISTLEAVLKKDGMTEDTTKFMDGLEKEQLKKVSEHE